MSFLSTTRHPSETDLALYASGDNGAFARFRLTRHLATCPECRDNVASFSDFRASLREANQPDLDWYRLSTEMRANIRVGLAAGECVRPSSPASAQWAFRPQYAIGAALVLMLAGAGVFLRGLLPHAPLASLTHASVVESTGAGVELRTDSGSMTLLNPALRNGESSQPDSTNQTVTSQGAIRAVNVDGNTGTVTVTSVYVD